LDAPIFIITVLTAGEPAFVHENLVKQVKEITRKTEAKFFQQF
jgi:hypothetical protein